MNEFFKRAHNILDRLEKLFLQSIRVSFVKGNTNCWKYSSSKNNLIPVQHLSKISLNDLRCIDEQKQRIITNTKQFINGFTANNALLWGPRGTGKSSLIKALLNEYKDDGLKLIEIQKNEITKLPLIYDQLYKKSGYFILFFDDLSFQDNDAYYKTIKVNLDGSVQQIPDNVVVYATSNRRNLVSEHMIENLDTKTIQGELHHGDSTEDKLALAERFGLRISFHPFSQDSYLHIVEYWLKKMLGISGPIKPRIRQAALEWALQNGSRSGRTAMLFSRDWAGKQQLEEL